MSIQMIAHYSMPMTATPDIYYMEADVAKEEVLYLSASSYVPAILSVAMMVFIGYILVRYLKLKTKVVSGAGIHIWALLLSMLLLASSAQIERCEVPCSGGGYDTQKTVVQEQYMHSLTPSPDVTEEAGAFCCTHF